MTNIELKERNKTIAIKVLNGEIKKGQAKKTKKT